MEIDLDRIGGRRTLDALVDEVLGCGEEALKLYRAGAARRAETKPDRTPVTEADRAVEARLHAFVQKAWPDAAFIGEESGSHEGDERLRVVVDPIDGTRAFLRGLPTWSVLVGIELDREPAVGVAFMPAAGDLFVAARGHGAYVNGRPARMSAVGRLEDALVSHGGLEQFARADAMGVLDRLASHTYTQRGFADFDGYRQMLLGRADAMIDPGVAPWDICAASVLVREAGGRLTSFDGGDTIYDGSAVASNGPIHDALVALIRE